MNCRYCDVKNEEKIYEDEKLVAIMPENGMAAGHIVVVPKQHYRIIEEVPDEDISRMFNVANKLSALVFETLGVHGTNIIVHNGTPGQDIPHFSIHIIPRTEGDGINLEWKPEKFSDDDLEGFSLLIKDGLKGKPFKKEEKKPDIDEIEQIEQDDEEDNYLIKQLDRMP